MNDHLCMSGPHCCDKIDNHPRETTTPNTLCDKCLTQATQHTQQLPHQYLRLHHIIGQHHTGIDTNIRHQKPGSQIPLNLHIDTLLQNIHHTTGTAAEILADHLNMNNPSASEPTTYVLKCCRIIAPNLPKLLPLTTLDIMFWNRSGTLRGVTTTSGTQIVQQLSHLSTLAHFTLGLTRARTHRDLPCTRCQAKTVGRWAGSDDYDCSSCGARFPEADIRRQDKILLELCRRGLIHAPMALA